MDANEKALLVERNAVDWDSLDYDRVLAVMQGDVVGTDEEQRAARQALAFFGR